MRYLLAISIALMFAITACKHAPTSVGQNNIDPIEKSVDDPLIGSDEPKEVKTLVEDDIDENDLEYAKLLLEPVFFDYDRSEIRQDQIQVLQINARTLKESGSMKVEIQGHCDERGTEEYNLALGDLRARTVQEYLISIGIDPERLQTITYGESQPFDDDHNENAWRQNRRAHFLQKASHR